MNGYNIEVLKRIAGCDVINFVHGPIMGSTYSVVTIGAYWNEGRGQVIEIIQELYNEELARWIIENN